MTTILAVVITRFVHAARVMVPTFGVAGVLVMTRSPELWATVDASGNTNWLPFITLGCLSATLVGLLRMRADDR